MIRDCCTLKVLSLFLCYLKVINMLLEKCRSLEQALEESTAVESQYTAQETEVSQLREELESTRFH